MFSPHATMNVPGVDKVHAAVVKTLRHLNILRTVHIGAAAGYRVIAYKKDKDSREGKGRHCSWGDRIYSFLCHARYFAL